VNLQHFGSLFARRIYAYEQLVCEAKKKKKFEIFYRDILF